ncbi:MAG TPA: hypothetical protein EYQ43_01630 [Methyloprofundus sp.]|nr:hypothetical protein [Methyloprofundus sp.]
MPQSSGYHENAAKHEPKRELLGVCANRTVFRGLKNEQLNYEKFRTKAAAKLSMIDYLAFYNGKRTHSKLDYQSPLELSVNFIEKESKNVSCFT